MRKLVRTAAWLAALAALCFAAFRLYDYFSESKDGSDSVDRLREIAVSEGAEGAPIKVDFYALQSENPDIVAWLYCEDTPINYPIVQAEDNSYYLHRLTDESYNANGTLFLDYRCAGDFTDFKSIVYGHRMKSKAMFGTLPQYARQEYYEEHPVMYLLTPQGDYKVLLAAGFMTSADSEDYDPADDSDTAQAFIDAAMSASIFKSDVECSVNDSLLCLSTCSYEYENARLMIMGKLVRLTD